MGLDLWNPFPLRWLPIAMKLPSKNMEYAARCCSRFNSTDACKLNATASHRPLSPRILTIYQGSGLVPAPWGKWAPATVTFNLEARWAKVLRLSIQKNRCISIGHCQSFNGKAGVAKSSFVQLLHFWGCQIQRKEYTINISVANCSPHQKIQLQVSLTSPPPKKKTRNPPPKSQLIASSHCRSVLFQTLACWIRSAIEDSPTSCVARFTCSLSYS